jgi:GAF domain-containing protein
VDRVNGGLQLDELQTVVEQLREETRASRTTIRVADATGHPVLVAESLADGVASMHVDAPPGGAIAAAPTYLELRRTGELLVQDDCLTDPIRPPASLIEQFRVYAQMLAPVIVGDVMIATISVHQQDAARLWAAEEIAALTRARERITALLAA